MGGRSNLPRLVLKTLTHAAVGYMKLDRPLVGTNDPPSGLQVRAGGAKQGRHHLQTIHQRKKIWRDKQMQTAIVFVKFLKDFLGNKIHSLFVKTSVPTATFPLWSVLRPGTQFPSLFYLDSPPLTRFPPSFSFPMEERKNIFTTTAKPIREGQASHSAGWESQVFFCCSNLKIAACQSRTRASPR